MLVDFTHRGGEGGEGEGRGGERCERKKKKKQELTQYPNTVDGNIAERRRVVKMEVFILAFFSFPFLGQASVLAFSSGGDESMNRSIGSKRKK